MQANRDFISLQGKINYRKPDHLSSVFFRQRNEKTNPKNHWNASKVIRSMVAG